jgi:hypothetical protein
MRLAAAVRRLVTAGLDWVFVPGDPRRAMWLRTGLCAVLTLRLATGPYLELARQPAALFRPISFLKVLGAMPPPAVVVPLQVVATAAAVLATAGVLTRVTLPVAWLGALPLMAMTSSLGKTVHPDVMLLLSLVPFLAARSGRRDPAAGAGWPVRTAMLVVAGAYFFSGLAKLLHAGPAWVFSGNLRWVLYASSDAAAEPNQLALWVAGKPWLTVLLAAGTIVLELGVPVVLVRPRLTWPVVASIVALHAGIWAAMRLNYWPMAATAALVLGLGGAWPSNADGPPVGTGGPSGRASGESPAGSAGAAELA